MTAMQMPGKNAGAAFAAEEVGAGVDCVGLEIFSTAISELEVGMQSWCWGEIVAGLRVSLRVAGCRR